MKRYVCGIMFSPDRQLVALILKNKPAWQRGRLNGIGGKIEQGESPLDAMVREFREETGIVTDPASWREVVRYVNPDNYEVHFYTAIGDVWAAQTLCPDEGEIGVYRVNPLPVDVIFNLNWLVPLCLDPCVTEAIRVNEAVTEPTP